MVNSMTLLDEKILHMCVFLCLLLCRHKFLINEVPVGFTFLGVKDYPENVCNEKADFHLNEK